MKRPIHSADDGETLTITTQFGDEPAEQHPISPTDLDQLEEEAPSSSPPGTKRWPSWRTQSAATKPSE